MNAPRPPAETDTGESFSQGTAAQEIAWDEQLLAHLGEQPCPASRWYQTYDRAIVVGLAQHAKLDDLLDRDRCVRLGWAIVPRLAGGGLVLLDAGVLCLTVALPTGHPLWQPDLTESYRWLGEACAVGLRRLGVPARRVEVAEARAQAATCTPLARRLCFCGWSPHEVVSGETKLVGLAQVRRAQGCLLQAGVLLRDQSALADALQVSGEAERDEARHLLRSATTGVTAAAGQEITVRQVWQAIRQAVEEQVR